MEQYLKEFKDQLTSSLIKDMKGLYIITNYGKIGTDGKTSRKHYKTIEALNKAYDRTLADKLKKDYVVGRG